MATRMQQRRGTAAQWTAANPVLGAGEIGFETDTNKFKVGNGSTAYTSLQYFVDASVVFDSSEVTSTVNSAIDAVIDAAPGTLNTLNELAAAIGDDPSFAQSIGNGIANIQNTLTAQGTTNQGFANSINDLQSDLANTNNNLSTLITDLGSTNNNVSTLDTEIDNHASANTNVHGISNAFNLVYEEDLTLVSNNLSDHGSANTSVHGISNTLNLVYTSDSRLSDERTPSSTSVTAAKIASDAVETIKIANAAVTAAKLASDSVETAKIADGAVTDAKLANNIAQSHISNLVTDLGLLASQSSVDLKAPLASPVLTGTPTAPTANTATNTTQLATTAFVQQEIAILTDSAPGVLNTLDELAAALGDDANFAAATANTLALKAPLASPTFTGLVTVAANGIAYTDGTQAKEGVPSRTPIISKTASYTLSAESERDSLIEVSSVSGTTITIPLNSAVAYPVGTTLDILQTNTGQVTIAGDAGVTVDATPGYKLRAQWSSATLFKRNTNTWVVFGDLTA